jgi:xanthine dehydrogenase small subunit
MTHVVGRGVAFAVNGSAVEVRGPGGRRLLDALRGDLALTGTKEGCGEGECGACSVIIDGELVNSCLVPLCQVEGRQVTTVEALADGDRLDPLQAAFLETGGAQCGFCTPGMLLAGHAFLASGTAANEEAVREAIAGNLCRCTGYTKIVEAIRLAAVGAPGGRIAGSSVREPWPVGARLGLADEPPADWNAAGGRAPTGGPEVLRAGTLAAALRILAETPLRPIAGGTDVMVELAAHGSSDSAPLLDIRSLQELRGIRLEHGELFVGALTTYAEMRRSPLVQQHVPALARMAAMVGAVQVQNRGTLGGNIVNASPAGDMLPVLLATDASILLAGLRGERTIPAAAFWTGYRQTVRAADELVLGVRIPLPAGRTVEVRKVGTRRAQAISKVVLAVAWRPLDGAWRDVRVALGSVADRPVRAGRTEALLEGARPSLQVADSAAASIAAEIAPIDDVRSSASYRRSVSGRILRRIVLDGAGE